MRCDLLEMGSSEALEFHCGLDGNWAQRRKGAGVKMTQKDVRKDVADLCVMGTGSDTSQGSEHWCVSGS